jgi:hypothetical protein
MSDNIVATTAAATTIKPESEACYSCIALQIENATLNAENEALEANYATLWIAYQMLAKSANAGLNAYKALEKCEDNFEDAQIEAFVDDINFAEVCIAKVLAGEILELPVVDEVDEAAAAAEDEVDEAATAAEAEAKKRAEASAEAAVGVSWGDEPLENPNPSRRASPHSEPLPAPKAVINKTVSAPLPSAPRDSGVKFTVRKNQSSLFAPVARGKEGLTNWYITVTEHLGKKCNNFCKDGSSCTRSNCGFNHICKNYGLKGDVIVLACTKSATECSHVHHQCPFGKGCKRTDCKAAH